MHINELKAKSPQQLLKMAEDMGIENPSQLNVQQLRFAVMRVYAADNKVTLIGDGVLERLQDGFGFLRAPESNYLAGPDDLYVSPPSRNSNASNLPVDAPDGTDARPNAPPDNLISHSIVGLPRLSMI